MSVLRWCSPQSLTPRHTVGSHAKAAKYEMGRLGGSREPTVWKCPGLPGQLPHRSRLTFSHIPTDRCAVGRTGAGADGPAVDSRQTHFWCVSLKIDSRAAKVSHENPPFRTWSKSSSFFFRTNAQKARRDAHSAATPQQRLHATAAHAANHCTRCTRRSAATQPLGLPPPRLSPRTASPHIPTDRCAAGRTYPGADGPAVNSRQTHFGCVPLKIDSRAAKVDLENPPFRTSQNNTLPTPHRSQNLTQSEYRAAYHLPPLPETDQSPTTKPEHHAAHRPPLTETDQAKIPRWLPPTALGDQPSPVATLPTSHLSERLTKSNNAKQPTSHLFQRLTKSEYHTAYLPPL